MMYNVVLRIQHALLDCQLMRKEAGEMECFETHEGQGQLRKASQSDVCLAFLSTRLLRRHWLSIDTNLSNCDPLFS